jgi:hypothetical protein
MEEFTDIKAQPFSRLSVEWNPPEGYFQEGLGTSWRDAEEYSSGGEWK